MAKTFYKVIEILDQYSVIINYGSSNYAKKGTEVRIIDKGPEIFDPTTGLSLGTMDHIKAELTITTVYERFSICQKIKEHTTNSLLNPLAQLQIIKYEKKLLEVDEKDISNKKAPVDNVIRPGDVVEVL